ncbi:MAG: GNAT family N-acetyltransferase [Actinomycetales bacterium]|nr:GNAT family N-acetyltransferase [Actinomycetales bacterium]
MTGMSGLEVGTFDDRYQEQAAAMVAASFARLRSTVPVLPGTLELPDAVAGLLDQLLSDRRGVMATRDGRLVGFLGWYVIEGFRDTDRTAALCPAWGHATTGPDREAVYRALYREASAEWSRTGCRTHAVAVLADDDVARRTWFWLGFGLTVVDAIRATTSLGEGQCPAVPDGVTLRRAVPEDAATILTLENEHWRHYTQPPMFMPVTLPLDPAEIETVLSGAVSGYWLATCDGEPAGFLRFEPVAQGATELVASATTIAITGAYVRPSRRGRGIATALLDASLRDYAGRGYTRCSTDFESFNPEAASFWPRYFTPVCLSMTRVPEA